MKTTKTITIDKDIIDEILIRGINFSELVNELMTTYLKDNSVEFQKAKLISEIEKAKEKIRVIDLLISNKESNPKAFGKKVDYIFSDSEIDFFNTTISLLSKNPTLIDGRKRYYNNEFAKNINITEFRELLDCFRLNYIENEKKN